MPLIREAVNAQKLQVCPWKATHFLYHKIWSRNSETPSGSIFIASFVLHKLQKSTIYAIYTCILRNDLNFFVFIFFLRNYGMIERNNKYWIQIHFEITNVSIGIITHLEKISGPFRWTLQLVIYQYYWYIYCHLIY